MAISRMKRLVLAAPREEADRLVKKLTWAGCLELTDASDELKGDSASWEEIFSPAARREALSEAVRCRSRLEEAMAIASPYADAPKGLFLKKSSYHRSLYDAPEETLTEALLLADRLKEREARLKRESEAKEAALLFRESLQPWLTTAFPPGETGTEKTLFFTGSLPVTTEKSLWDNTLSEAFSGEPPLYYEEVFSDKSRRYLVGAVLKESAAALWQTLAGLGYVKIDFSSELAALGEMPASFSALSEELQEKIDAGKTACESERDTLSKLAEKLDRLELAFDINETRIARLEAEEKLLLSGHALLLTGWAPEKALPRLEAIFAGLPCCCYTLSDPEEEEDVPVLLDNKRLFRPFESVVDMYSLPVYGSYDPTPILSIFYFVIFGLMLGDVAYGLLLTVGCFLAVRKLDLGGGAKQMIGMFGICGISSLFSGVLFGGYFGNFPSQIVETVTGRPLALPGVDLLSSDGIFFFIFLSLGVGALQILTSLAIKFYMLWHAGKRFDAIFDIGVWYVIFAGIALLAAVNTIAGAIVTGIGVLARIATAGRHNKNIFAKIGGGFLGLYGIVGFASDLISYMRIMALGLSTTVIAYVVNVMATLLISPGFSVGSVVGWLLLPVIMIGGHLLNFALGVLGCFVHDGRLQYIEFFGRFYEDGGRPFVPLKPTAKFTHIDYGE